VLGERVNRVIRQRIIGAIVLCALLIVFLPAIFTMPSKPDVKRIDQIPKHPPIKPAVISEPVSRGFERVDDIRTLAEPQEETLVELSEEQPQQPQVSAKRWVVQVASFVDRADADQLAKRIVDETDQVSFVKTVVINGNRHRVYVGPFLSRDDSVSAKKQIDKRYSVEALILTMQGAG